jgi:hypothetical protein
MFIPGWVLIVLLGLLAFGILLLGLLIYWAYLLKPR